MPVPTSSAGSLNACMASRQDSGATKRKFPWAQREERPGFKPRPKSPAKGAIALLTRFSISQNAASCMNVCFGEGFLMRLPTLRCVWVHERPALKNLPRTKLRGSWWYLWGKCADARCDGDVSVPIGTFHSAGHKRIAALWPGDIGLVWCPRFTVKCNTSNTNEHMS